MTSRMNNHTSASSPTFLEQIHHDLLTELSQYLDLSSITSISLVCKNWIRVSNFFSQQSAKQYNISLELPQATKKLCELSRYFRFDREEKKIYLIKNGALDIHTKFYVFTIERALQCYPGPCIVHLKDDCGLIDDFGSNVEYHYYKKPLKGTIKKIAYIQHLSPAKKFDYGFTKSRRRYQILETQPASASKDKYPKTFKALNKMSRISCNRCWGGDQDLDSRFAKDELTKKEVLVFLLISGLEKGVIDFFNELFNVENIAPKLEVLKAKLDKIPETPFKDFLGEKILLKASTNTKSDYQECLGLITEIISTCNLPDASVESFLRNAKLATALKTIDRVVHQSFNVPSSDSISDL
jgi:hypothetical protein